MDTKQIRRQLQQGRIPEAYRAYAEVAPPDLRRRAAQLFAQFSALKPQHEPPSAPTFSQFRLLYAAFHLVSLYESRQHRAGAATALLVRLERDLAAGYRRLAMLGRQSLVDRFMRWMIKRHPAGFYEFVQQEKLTGAPTGMTAVLANFDLEVFRQHTGVRMPLALMRQLLYERGQETPDFFCHWLDQAAYRIRYSQELLSAVEQSRLRHTALLIGDYEARSCCGSDADQEDELTIGAVFARFEPSRKVV